LEQATAVAIGPGLGRSATLTKLVGQLYATVRQPMVVDADALNALAELGDAIQQPAGPRILTPHPGEFARLSDDPIGDESERIAAAAKLAKRMRAIVVLKGHRTVVADGRDHYVNETGNPGMATGGTGDVLTGVITGLLCLGSDPFDAARLGVYVHGLAGDLAATEVGQTSLTASDLVEQLSDAWSGVAP
jgi:NAD(P)H-hydrate epimerase